MFREATESASLSSKLNWTRPWQPDHATSKRWCWMIPWCYPHLTQISVHFKVDSVPTKFIPVLLQLQCGFSIHSHVCLKYKDEISCWRWDKTVRQKDCFRNEELVFQHSPNKIKMFYFSFRCSGTPSFTTFTSTRIQKLKLNFSKLCNFCTSERLSQINNIQK